MEITCRQKDKIKNQEYENKKEYIEICDLYCNKNVTYKHEIVLIV